VLQWRGFLIPDFLNAAAVKFNSSTQLERDALRDAVRAGKVISSLTGIIVLADYFQLLDNLADEIGQNKVNRLKDLITVVNARTAAATNTPLEQGGLGPTPNLNTITQISGFQHCSCTTYNKIDINSFFVAAGAALATSPPLVQGFYIPTNGWKLLENAITIDANKNVYLIAARASASLFGAQIMNITRNRGVTSQFMQSSTGLFELTSTGPTGSTTEDFTDLVTKLTKNKDFCWIDVAIVHSFCLQRFKMKQILQLFLKTILLTHFL
jgi:hypothetical protein